jgi:hypothetical protein
MKCEESAGLIPSAELNPVDVCKHLGVVVGDRVKMVHGISHEVCVRQITGFGELKALCRPVLEDGILGEEVIWWYVSKNATYTKVDRPRLVSVAVSGTTAEFGVQIGGNWRFWASPSEWTRRHVPAAKWQEISRIMAEAGKAAIEQEPWFEMVV